jgi:demethylmenaquinone methyltransferase/2-methoxy-6-polyprenyl-1,4-benzoquinol methylase
VSETAVARTLFAPLGPTYDRYAALLSLGQDPRWRRTLVSRVDVGPGDTVLDVATGTGAVALELLRQKGCTVVGLVAGDAESVPFPDGAFAAVTFAYPLRYVADPGAALRELARVIRPGGTLAGLEFGIPRGFWRPWWELYVRVGLPLAGRVISPAWGSVGSFLGPSIRAFYARWPEAKLLDLWRQAGIGDVRAERLSLGGGIVTWGHRT